MNRLRDARSDADELTARPSPASPAPLPTPEPFDVESLTAFWFGDNEPDEDELADLLTIIASRDEQHAPIHAAQRARAEKESRIGENWRQCAHGQRERADHAELERDRALTNAEQHDRDRRAWQEQAKRMERLALDLAERLYVAAKERDAIAREAEKLRAIIDDGLVSALESGSKMLDALTATEPAHLPHGDEYACALATERGLEAEKLRAALTGMLEHCSCQGRGYRSWDNFRIVKHCQSVTCRRARALLGLPDPPEARP